ncbi:MAG: hypothetical protein PHR77_18240 [Kiritimatiellae bacterium]|nr:hypothetical protein [Kiritimatiellia bacterium]MDD5519756.1 hypothetical protein [Kiritimatiellia bacterium]
MKKIAFIFLLVIMFCSGCVSRTITRSPRLFEVDKNDQRVKVDKVGEITETKTIWFWQKEYWRY